MYKWCWETWEYQFHTARTCTSVRRTFERFPTVQCPRGLQNEIRSKYSPRICVMLIISVSSCLAQIESCSVSFFSTPLALLFVPPLSVALWQRRAFFLSTLFHRFRYQSHHVYYNHCARLSIFLNEFRLLSKKSRNSNDCMKSHFSRAKIQPDIASSCFDGHWNITMFEYAA